MTSGMSAKGSALGASVPGSGVPPKRAPAPRAPVSAGNGARRGHAATIGTDSREAGIGETEGTFAGSIGAESVPPALSSNRFAPSFSGSITTAALCSMTATRRGFWPASRTSCSALS